MFVFDFVKKKKRKRGKAVTKDSNKCLRPQMSVFVSKVIALAAFHSFDLGIKLPDTKGVEWEEYIIYREDIKMRFP